MVDPEETNDGVRLDALMKRAGVKPRQLAEAAGVSEVAVGKWISEGTISRTRIPIICRTLKCSADELLGLVPIRSEGSSVREVDGHYAVDRTLMHQAIAWTMEGLELDGGRTAEETAALILAIFDMLVESGNSISKPVVLRMIRGAA